MVKWKKMNKKMAGLLLGVMMLFTASTTAFAYMFFAVANTFANTFYMQTNGFGKLRWYLNHSHSCGLNRVIRVYHYPVLQVMAERLFQRSLPDHCMNRYLPIGKVTAYNL